MNKALKDQVLQLPPDERLALMGELWDSLDEADVPLTEAQIAEAKRRLAEHRADPSTAVPWEEVRARVWSRLK